MRGTGSFDKGGEEIMEGHHLQIDGSRNEMVVVYADGSIKYNHQIGFVLIAVNNSVQWSMVDGSRCKIIKKQ